MAKSSTYGFHFFISYGLVTQENPLLEEDGRVRNILKCFLFSFYCRILWLSSQIIVVIPYSSSKSSSSYPGSSCYKMYGFIYPLTSSSDSTYYKFLSSTDYWIILLIILLWTVFSVVLCYEFDYLNFYPFLIF